MRTRPAEKPRRPSSHQLLGQGKQRQWVLDDGMSFSDRQELGQRFCQAIQVAAGLALRSCLLLMWDWLGQHALVLQHLHVQRCGMQDLEMRHPMTFQL